MQVSLLDNPVSNRAQMEVLDVQENLLDWWTRPLTPCLEEDCGIKYFG